MGTLNSSDILGEIKKEEKIAETPREEQRRTAEEIGSYKPSPYLTELRAKLRVKVQCNIGTIPRFINDEFERLINDSGMNKKEFFYHLIREAGAKVPPYEEMDGRKL